MRILGIDPGYAIVGYGVLDYVSGRFSVVGFGAVTTPADLPFEKRLKMIYEDIKPNYTHIFLKELEDANKLKAIVTQNIDNLHEQVGSKNIYHIHGTINTNHCIDCNKEYSLEELLKIKDNPICSCGGKIKPDVVLYGEMLPEDAYQNGLKAISEADTLIIAGTSLTVYPAAGMIRAFNGKNLIILNKDHINIPCTLQINDKLGEIFKNIKIRS